MINQIIIAHVEGAPHIHGHEAVGIVITAIILAAAMWGVVRKGN
tara:strand:+ start:11849 stop:11980 length:132 start_codon:yes stop_codon:yes gene_type:complete